MSLHIVRVRSSISGRYFMIKRLSLFYLQFTVAQFMYIIRKRIQLPPEKAMFLFVNKVLPTTRFVSRPFYFLLGNVFSLHQSIFATRLCLMSCVMGSFISQRTGYPVRSLFTVSARLSTLDIGVADLSDLSLVVQFQLTFLLKFCTSLKVYRTMTQVMRLLSIETVWKEKLALHFMPKFPFSFAISKCWRGTT